MNLHSWKLPLFLCSTPFYATNTWTNDSFAKEKLRDHQKPIKSPNQHNIMKSPRICIDNTSEFFHFIPEYFYALTWRCQTWKPQALSETEPDSSVTQTYYKDLTIWRQPLYITTVLPPIHVVHLALCRVRVTQPVFVRHSKENVQLKCLNGFRERARFVTRPNRHGVHKIWQTDQNRMYHDRNATESFLP